MGKNNAKKKRKSEQRTPLVASAGGVSKEEKIEGRGKVEGDLYSQIFQDTTDTEAEDNYGGNNDDVVNKNGEGFGKKASGKFEKEKNADGMKKASFVAVEKRNKVERDQKKVVVDVGGKLNQESDIGKKRTVRKERRFVETKADVEDSSEEEEVEDVVFDDDEVEEEEEQEFGGVSSSRMDVEESDDGDEGEEEDGQEDESEEEEESDGEEKSVLRRQLKDLSFEELEALKQKMGLKEYNEAMFGSKTKKGNQKRRKFERKNKNRPREISSKVRVPKLREVVTVAKKVRKDPRFDNSCGEFSEKFWNTEYSFVRDLQKKEAEELKKTMKTVNDKEKKREMRRFIQKVADKEKSIAVKQQEAQKRIQDREENRKRVEEGKRPFYMKKSTKKLVDLVEKYDELKASGGLEKYLKKKRKKNAFRDKKSLQPFK